MTYTAYTVELKPDDAYYTEHNESVFRNAVRVALNQHTRADLLKPNYDRVLPDGDIQNHLGS